MKIATTLVIMFLIFMTLKLMNYIAWSWWFVTAPLWLPWMIIILPIVIGGLLITVLNKFKK